MSLVSKLIIESALNAGLELIRNHGTSQGKIHDMQSLLEGNNAAISFKVGAYVSQIIMQIKSWLLLLIIPAFASSSKTYHAEATAYVGYLSTPGIVIFALSNQT